jgi:hypothetical protein
MRCGRRVPAPPNGGIAPFPSRHPGPPFFGKPSTPTASHPPRARPRTPTGPCRWHRALWPPSPCAGAGPRRRARKGRAFVVLPPVPPPLVQRPRQRPPARNRFWRSLGGSGMRAPMPAHGPAARQGAWGRGRRALPRCAAGLPGNLWGARLSEVVCQGPGLRVPGAKKANGPAFGPARALRGSRGAHACVAGGASAGGGPAPGANPAHWGRRGRRPHVGGSAAAAGPVEGWPGGGA